LSRHPADSDVDAEDEVARWPQFHKKEYF
jgi:hypothetical protein